MLTKVRRSDASPNVFEQPFGHLVFLIHMGQWLQHRTVTVRAAIALSLRVDPDTLAMHRQIDEELLASAKALQQAKTLA